MKELSKRRVSLAFLHPCLLQALFIKVCLVLLLSGAAPLFIEKLSAGEVNISRLPSGVPGSADDLLIWKNAAHNFDGLPLASVTKLDMAYALLRAAPLWIAEKLPNLEVLHLERNLIHVLPTEFTRLKKLKSLELTDNFIKDLPDNIGDLSNLEQLVLRGNALQLIPKSIAKATKLTHLDLREMRILEKGTGGYWGKKELRAHFGERVLLDD